MHWVLQREIELNSTYPAPGPSRTLQIDYAGIWKYVP